MAKREDQSTQIVRFSVCEGESEIDEIVCSVTISQGGTSANRILLRRLYSLSEFFNLECPRIQAEKGLVKITLTIIGLALSGIGIDWGLRANRASWVLIEKFGRCM